MMTAIKSAFGSRKFLATLIGAVVVAAGSAVGLSEDQATKIAGMIIAYVLGQGIADVGKERTQAKIKATTKALAVEVEDLAPAEKAAALREAAGE